MLLSAEDLCSDHQALGDSAVTNASSTNVIDVGSQRSILDDRLRFIVKIDNPDTIAGGTSVAAAVQTSADNSNWTTVAETGTVALANIPKNGILLDAPVPTDTAGKKYWRVAYTTVGSFTSGKGPVVTAGFVRDGGPVTRKTIPVA